MPYVPIKLPAGFYKNGTEYQSLGRWHDGSLVRWLDGSLRPVEGWTERKTYFSNNPVRGMHTWQANNGNAWIAAGSANELIAMTGGGTVYYITPDDLTAGVINSEVSTGYGFGPYGTGYWGQPRPVSSDQVPVESTTWQFDNFGEELVGVHSTDGRIWNWDLTTTIGSELVVNGDFSANTNWTSEIAFSNVSKFWNIASGVASFTRLEATIDTTKEGYFISPNAHNNGNYDHIDINANLFRASPNRFIDGYTVKYRNGGGTDIGGLVNDTNYFIVNSSGVLPSGNDFQISATSGGSPITLNHVDQSTFNANDATSTMDGVDYENNRIYTAHVFSENDPVVYNRDYIASGATGNERVISGLTEGGEYFAVGVQQGVVTGGTITSNTSFQLSATSGGAPIDIEKDGHEIPADAAYSPSNTVTVTVVNVGGANVFAMNGAVQAELELIKGNAYWFDNFDASNQGHPIIFKHNGVQYTSGVSSSGSAGYGSSYVYFDIPMNAPDNLTYSCSVHGDAMGGNITTITNSSSAGYPVVTYTSNIIDTFTPNSLYMDDQVEYKVLTGGAAIDGLVDGTVYFVEQSFGLGAISLSATLGGARINLTEPPEAKFDASDATIVDIANNKIIHPNSFADGMKVYYNKGNGAVIGGLTHNADYFIVNRTASEFQLSATSGGAPISLTSLGISGNTAKHLIRKRLGQHQLNAVMGTTNTIRKNLGSNHTLSVIDNGTAIEQNVTGLVPSPDSQDSHDITCTLIDPQNDPTWNSGSGVSAQLKVTGISTGTIVLQTDLSLGVNQFRFGADDANVKVEVTPNSGSRHFDIDNISLKKVTVAEPITNAPISNKGVLVTEERFIFALGAGGNSRKVQWCDKEDKVAWSPSATNEAGDVELATSGQIMCGVKTRGVTLIITDTDAHVAQYIGPPYVYGFQKIGSNCGAISRLGSVSTDVGAFWFGMENFHYFDGNSVQTLNCDVHDHVFGDFNASQQSKIWGIVNGAHNEIWWFYCSGEATEIDRYVAFDYKDKHWLIGNLSRTSGVSRGVFTYPFMASHNTTSTIYNHEVGYNYDGASIFCETGPIAIGSGDQVINVTGVISDEKTQGDVDLKFKTKFHPNDVERTYPTSGAYNPSNPTSVRFSGRQIKMRVEGDQKTDWQVGTMRLDVKAGSKR